MTVLGIVVFGQPKTSVLLAVSIIACALSRLSYTVLPLSTTIDSSEEQPAKAYFPILVTLLGIVIEASEEQASKAKLPIIFTLSGITTLVNEEQS